MSYDLSLYYYLKDYVNIIYLNGNRDHTIVRCPICGDSKKDPRKARLYIENKSPYRWYCFNCDSCGIINDNILGMLTSDSYDINFLKDIKHKQKEYINKKNKVCSKIYSKNKYFKQKPVFSHNKLYTDKLEYLEQRLGVTLNYSDIDKFKIVLSIIDFYKDNDLDINKRITTDKEEYIVKNLDEKYVGFLSADKNIIIFRNIDKNEEKYRFNNFNIINNDYIDGKKTYTIENDINLLQESYPVRIAEGPIDIISTYLNVCNEEERNSSIFIGNGGKGYINSADYITNLGFLSSEYHIYSDNDVNLGFYKKIKENSSSLRNNPIYIYYNQKSKDFGVPRENIKISKGVKV